MLIRGIVQNAARHAGSAQPHAATASLCPGLLSKSRDQTIFELALRQQLAAYARQRPRPRLTSVDRTRWVALHRLWPRFEEVPVVVKPDSAIRLRRKAFRLHWHWKSRSRCGRPKLEVEFRALIRRMFRDNPTWGRRRIRAERTTACWQGSPRHALHLRIGGEKAQ